MRSLVIVLVFATVSAGSAARAGAPKLIATACAIDGDPLAFADRVGEHGALAVAPNGDVFVLDGANHVRRYRPRSGKGCALVQDRSFGTKGVLDVGIGADRESVTLAVDADGTIYVSDVPKQPVRVKGGKVEKMCGDATRVNASALSKVVWRYEWASEATRELGDCSGAESAYLKDWDVGASHLWVIDERAVAWGEVEGGGHKLLLYGADGGELEPLAMPTASFFLPERFTRCGKQICALESGGGITWWNDRGAIAGSANGEVLVGGDRGEIEVVAIDLDGATGTTYLLVQHGTELGDRTAGAIYRIDGFAK